MIVQENPTVLSPALFEGNDVDVSELLKQPFVVRRTNPDLIGGISEAFWTIPTIRWIPRPAPDIQQYARELRAWTGWSSRKLADILGTTHTTILAIEDGRPLMAARSGKLRRRLEEAHGVVRRVFQLASRDIGHTASLLERVPAGGTSTAADLLRADRSAAAYLAALDVLQPPETGDLLVGLRPASPGGATAPLTD